MLARKVFVARQVQHLRYRVVHGLVGALNCVNRVVFVWNRGKDTNTVFIKEPVSYNGFHKLIVRPDNFKYFAPRGDPPVKFV